MSREVRLGFKQTIGTILHGRFEEIERKHRREEVNWIVFHLDTEYRREDRNVYYDVQERSQQSPEEPEDRVVIALRDVLDKERP